jgi:quercetin dioxygenase-like cupin family protein
MDNHTPDLKALHDARNRAVQKAFSLGINWDENELIYIDGVKERSFSEFNIPTESYVEMADADGRVCRMRDITPNGGVSRWIYCHIDAGFRIPFHRHSDFRERLYLEQGEALITVGNPHVQELQTNFKLKEDEVLVIGKDIPHAGEYSKTSRVLLILTPITFEEEEPKFIYNGTPLSQ